MADTPGIELGALDVALRATGADTVQAAFEAIDKAGQATAASTAKAASAVQDFGRLTSSEIQKAADWFDKTYAAQLNAAKGQASVNQEIAAELTELQQLARQVDVTKAHEVERFMATAAASKEWLVAQNANQQQMLRFDGVMQGLNRRVEQVGERGAHSFKLMAGNAAVLTAGVGSSVRSMDSLLANAANLGFMFGPEGQIAASVAIFGSILVREFLHWRNEITETRQTASDELRKLAMDADAAETESAARAQQRIVLAAQEGVNNAKLALEKVQQQVGATSVAELAARRAPDASISKLTDAEQKLTAAQNDMNEAMAKQRTLNALLLQQRQDEFRAQQAQLNIDRLEREASDEATAAAERRRKGLQALATAQREAWAEETKLERAMSKFEQRVTAGMQGELGKLLTAGTPKLNVAAQGFNSPDFLNGLFGEDFRAHVAETMRLIGGDVLVEQQKALADTKAQADAAFASFGADLAGTFASSIGAAFTGGFKSMGKVILSGLGHIFETMGEKLVAYGATMLKLLPFLQNPFTSGPAALVAGAALIALGASLGAIATGTGGAGGAGGLGTVAGVGEVTGPVRGTAPGVAVPHVGAPVTPVRPVQVINPVFLSPRTPEFQAIIADTYNYADGRGLIRRSA